MDPTRTTETSTAATNEAIVVNPGASTTPAPFTGTPTPTVGNETEQPPATNVGTTPQIMELDLKLMYRRWVEYALKHLPGEFVNVSACEDELLDELAEYDYCVKGNKISVGERQRMLMHIGTFALAAATGLEILAKKEEEGKKSARTLVEAANEQMRKLLPAPGGEIKQENQPARQHLSLNSVFSANGHKYEVKRAPLVWDGVMISGPHGPGGHMHCYTITEAILADLLEPIGFEKPKSGISPLLGQFTYKDVHYGIINPYVKWDERSMAIHFTDPNKSVLQVLGPLFALEKNLIIRMSDLPSSSVERRLFRHGPALYEMLHKDVSYEPMTGMIVKRTNMVESRYNIEGAIHAKLIQWVKTIQ